MVKLCAFADEASSSLQGQISALKNQNITLIEIRSVDGKNVADFTNEEVELYKKMLDDSGIKVWSIGSPLGKVDITVDFEKYLEKINRVYDIAVQFGAKRVRAFSFFNAYDSEQEVISRLQVAVNLAKEKGLVFCHENEKEIFGDTVERVLILANKVENLKLVYDPANYIQVGENAANALEKTLTFTEYFHIKDVIFETGELVPAGYGDGNILGLLNDIKNRDAVLTLEPHLKIFDGYGAIDNTEMKNRFTFESNLDAFNCAVDNLKALLIKAGYKENKGEFIL